MRTVLMSVSVAFAAATASGCMMGQAARRAPTAQPAPAARPAPPVAAHAQAMPACPVGVPGTRLAAADTPEGVAVTFTTSPERAEELRARVHAMADMHNRHHQPGAAGGEHAGHGGMMHGGMMQHDGTAASGEAEMPMPPPSRATVEDVEAGARLSVAPYDPADLERLRSTVRMHAEQMQKTGTCEMGAPASHAH